MRLLKILRQTMPLVVVERDLLDTTWTTPGARGAKLGVGM
jgi:hypothetical protein